MRWITTKNGKKVDLDWFFKDQQIDYFSQQADILNHRNVHYKTGDPEHKNYLGSFSNHSLDNYDEETLNDPQVKPTSDPDPFDTTERDIKRLSSSISGASKNRAKLRSIQTDLNKLKIKVDNKIFNATKQNIDVSALQKNKDAIEKALKRVADKLSNLD